MSNTDKSAVATPGRPAVSETKRRRMRRQIADIAKALFQEEGYGTISMRRIAGEMGCSPMTLYKYYDAKADILRTLWGDVFDELFDQIEAVPETKDRYLQGIAMTYVQYWLDHPEYYRLVFLAEGVTQSDVSIFIENPDIVPRFNIFVQTLSSLGAGRLNSEELKTRSDAIICFLNGIVHNLITISDYPWSDPDKMVAMALKSVTD